MSSQERNPCQGYDGDAEPDLGQSEDFRKRALKQFDTWRDTWVHGTGSKDPDPVYPHGHMIKYLIEPDHTPLLDLLGGGGFTPHGHGNRVIGTALAKMANQAWQTSDRGDHAYSATAELMTKVEEHLPFGDPRWKFANSEAESFLLLMETFAKSGREVVVVNGPQAWPYDSSNRSWSNLPGLSPGNLLWKQIAREDKIAIVLYPVNSETFEVVSESTLGFIDSIKSQKDVTLVWDLSVSAGWTREPLDVHPDADAVILGGALGGGLPFGAIVSSEALPFPDSGRWSATAGNALVTQLGLHALLLSEGNEARDRYDVLVAAVGREVETLQTQLPGIVREVTGGGLLGGLKLNSVEEARRVVDRLKDRGVLVGSLGVHRGVVTFVVSRSTDPHDVTELFDKMFEILTEEDQR